MGKPNVLLAGEFANPSSDVAVRLATWDARCQFANSCQEVCALLGQQDFQLVISELKLADGSALQAAPLLEGSPTTMFCSLPVEDSCLWIQVVEKGRACFRPSIWRPREFGRVLRRVLEEA